MGEPGVWKVDGGGSGLRRKAQGGVGGEQLGEKGHGGDLWELGLEKTRHSWQGRTHS